MAGIVPNQPDEKHTRKFVITDEEWSAEPNHTFLFLTRSHEAIAYATQLGMHAAAGLEPNWVRLDYVWM